MTERPPTAREAILQAVRAARPAPIAAPDVARTVRGFAAQANGADTGDLPGRFAAAARTAGATVVEWPRHRLADVPWRVDPEARRVASAIDGVPGTMPLGDDPLALADAELFVCAAALGVAETGAVWVPGMEGAARAALFLATHVAIVLDRAALVADTHAAYDRMRPAGTAFGVLIAGPSKTADIEQSLVVGAHGPKALSILLLGDG